MNKAKWVGLVIGLAVVIAVALILRARSNREILVGCITPLTGEGASYGVATTRGITLAAERINAEGGIDGRPLQFLCEDDQMSGRVATSAIQKLTEIDKVPVILGAFGSSVTLAIAPIAEEKHVVLFSASSTADTIKYAGDYVFRNVPPNSAQGTTAADFADSFLGAQRASILHISNDYGVSLTQAFRTRFLANGGQILSVETYNPGASDFRAQLTKIRAERPDIVFYPGHYQESGFVLRQARELGLTATFVGGDGSYAPELIEIAGPAAEASYYTLMSVDFEGPNSDVQRFRSAYQSKYGEEPGVYSAYAYDAFLMIAEAIRRGGYNANGIKDALGAMDDFQGITGPTRFDRYGEVDKDFGVVEVRDGAFRSVTWQGSN